MAATPTNATAYNYEMISAATSEYFTMCEDTFQGKLTKSSYITDQYKSTISPVVESKSYDTTNIVPELRVLSNTRATGILNYIESVDLHIMSWDTYIGEPTNIVALENGETSCEVYIWTEFSWYNSDFPNIT